METVVTLVTVALAAVLIARELMWRRTVARLQGDLNAARAQGRHHERLANVGQLVSSLAQELKSPLQGVIGNTELMLASATPDTSAAEDLLGIQEGVTRAAGIVRNLLAFTETNALSRRWLDLNEVVTRAAGGCRGALEARGVHVELNTAERLPLVYVDGRQLEKVFVTLLARPSARSGSSGKTTVTVSTSRGRSDDRLVVEVYDNTAADGLVDTAWSSDLSACWQIVEAHGGALGVDRPPHGGCRIHLELPVTAGGAEAAAAGAP